MTTEPSLRARVKVRAPELVGRGWLNTGGRALSLADFRGRVLVLDFWTFCCVNCLHVLDELRPVEAQYPDALTIVGVHSPKFEHEADPDALAAAVERYAVHHPVLDDPELVTWRAYTARAWPTLVVVDPEGYVVASMSGEGHGPGLAALVGELIEEHAAKGTLQPGGDPFVPPPAPDTALRFPGKVVALDDGSFVVSDTANHQVVHLEADLETERRRWGGPGVLNEPQGLVLATSKVRDQYGVDLVVADSVNHQVKGIRFSDGTIHPLVGTGRQLRQRRGGAPARQQDLSTPWDLAWLDGRLIIAMAGTHQLWAWSPAGPPETAPTPGGTVEVIAGTTNEGLRDGPGAQAWFAQPSGLCTSADGRRVWVADSETSALRSVAIDDTGGLTVQTHVGTGLFDFGHRDGPAAQALLQHPLGVTELPDGSVAVSDTYNGAIRRYDPVTGEVTTLARDLAEPSDAVVEGDPESGRTRLVVVESAAHRLTRIALPEDAQRVDGPARRTQRPATELAPGEVRLEVTFVPPKGQKLDDRWGDPTVLDVSASPEGLLLDGGGRTRGLRRTLTLASGIRTGTLHVSVQAAACDGDPETDDLPEHAACHLFQQDWGIPLTLVADGPTELTLDLRGA
ncbi:NHL domain-containing thioredoxin family protein [Intrasporangium calvum]|uniref:NHL repeat containing protein n=1 Tax=Intrasporangium calvum (strain ATCC 23552 / DSM 43043 / JCM 3097 / NBRC 12989 / NCIMB 10167 / NRRL B-3866 / 7 KIP) TaxID=710696 RepID=E6S6T6_INTC7|nr:NHL domain-containing thioredoxin family protein [Intrasporangium calvum]ADU46822.1 NHL repeat containing protein [Intrasporangium calvum DSM 43043]